MSNPTPIKIMLDAADFENLIRGGTLLIAPDGPVPVQIALFDVGFGQLSRLVNDAAADGQSRGVRVKRTGTNAADI